MTPATVSCTGNGLPPGQMVDHYVMGICPLYTYSIDVDSVNVLRHQDGCYCFHFRTQRFRNVRIYADSLKVDTAPPHSPEPLWSWTCTRTSIEISFPFSRGDRVGNCDVWTCSDSLSRYIANHDLRYLTRELTEANWHEATAVSLPQPSTAYWGYRLTVTGLLPNTTYWFGVKAVDYFGNWSALIPRSTRQASTLP